ncbi:KAT8 regulatory NSL complex subunit 2 isoform X1 [Plutella xylostella]|uniref:KAT8 regulatory NSL complex subunit 2 isoform X1 n=2 Tax=Plutella xylostella TaxID=51655 RepID=UPI002032607B|nr:KAT8 regulatory NSL complex subunit 2 isoform X1 [Plutella xylostella]
MFSIKNENIDEQLFARHNIRVSQLDPTTSMAQQAQNSKKLIHLPKVRMLSRGRPPSSGVRITNVKSIKPPDPETAKKQEEDKLRKKVHKEIEARSKSCANKSYECLLPVVTGREYCAEHILQDPTAPYKQCSHTYNNDKRCPLPAPAQQLSDRRDQGLCFEHARAAMAARQRAAAPPKPVASTETLLNQLQHYIKPERTRTLSCASSVSVVSDPAEQEQLPAAVDPFKQMDAVAVNNKWCASIMECASASESDADSVTLGRDGDCRGGVDEDEDSVDDEPDHPAYALKRAGVFTAEEAVTEAKNCLQLLQSAYTRQMRRLRALLHQARYDYLKALKTERETCCSINSQARSNPLTARERRQLRKLKAYASFHRRHGTPAVLQRKLMKKRAKVNEPPSNRPIPSLGRCVFSEYGARCALPALPAARHCQRHVMCDPQQVLFVACGDTRGGVSCREAAPRLPLPSAACRYHTAPPHYTAFTLRKDGSDSDSETHTASTVSRSPSPPRDQPDT